MIALLEAAALAEPPEAPAIAYTISTTDGARKLVRGIQVGMFAVRAVRDELIMWLHGPERWSGFLVDHVPTKNVVWRARIFEHALLLADELSRRCGSKAETADRQVVKGEVWQMLDWLWHVDSADAPLDYRTWRNELGRAAKAAGERERAAKGQA